MEKPIVVIGIPSHGHWSAHFGMSLLKACMYTLTKAPVALKIINKRGSILPALREGIVLDAIKMKADHLIFLDCDQTFPADAFVRLLAHKKSVVACNIVTKAIPANPTARRKIKGNDYGEPVYTDQISSGLEKVWRVGCGIMLLDVKTLARLTTPRFAFVYKYDDQYLGEDWYLCEKLEAAGVSIYVDHDLSKQVGHVGDFEFVHDYVGQLAEH